MSRIVFTDEQLRQALLVYAAARDMQLPPNAAEPDYSARHIVRMESIFKRGRRRANRRKALRSVSAAVIVLLISFGMVLAVSPVARAAFLNWTVDIYNKVAEYRFNHAEDDHAELICAPESLPEGFDRVESVRNNNYALNVYKNPETGEYIRFEYSKASEALIAEVGRQSAVAELLTGSGSIEKYCLDAGTTRRVFWYDHQRQLVFFVDSSLSSTELAGCLETISIRLPLYEPVWLPEGYEEIIEERDIDYPGNLFVYADPAESVIAFIYYDMSELEGIAVDRLGDDLSAERLLINGNIGYYHPGNDTVPGSDLIIIDETNGLVFEINSTLSKYDIVHMAESILCTETEW